MATKPPQITLPEPLLCRTAQAAAISGVSPRKWAEMESAGQTPPCYRLGSCKVYKLSHLRQWVAWDMPSTDRFMQLLERKV